MQAGTVVQSLSPATFQMPNDQGVDWLVGIVSVSGGNPNVVTNWALLGGSLFYITGIDDTTAAIYTNAIITTPDDYDLTVVVTTSAGVVNFDRVVTVVAPAIALYNTPAPTTPWEVEFEFNGGVYEAVASNLIGYTLTTYATSKLIYPALEPFGVVKAKFGEGEFPWHGSGKMNGGGIVFEGATDGAGRATTKFIPTASGGTSINNVLGFEFNTTETSEVFWILNLVYGPTDADLALDITTQYGNSAAQFVRNGRINFINFEWRGLTDNGLEGATSYEWHQRTYSDVRCYGCHGWGCGTAADEHDIYYHCGKLEFHRGYLHDPGNQGHCLKSDCERLIITDSAIITNTGIGINPMNSTTAALNVTRTCDYRGSGNLIKFKGSSTGQGITVAARGNACGGFGKKYPPIVPTEDYPAGVRTSLGMLLIWHYGGTLSRHAVARVGAVTPAGSTSITVFGLSGDGNYTLHPLSTSQTYTWRIMDFATGSVQEFVGSPSVVGASTATVTIQAGTLKVRNGDNSITQTSVGASLQKDCALLSHIAVKVSGDAWDYLELNSEFWNDADPEYCHDKYRTAGALDLAKLAFTYCGILEDNLFVSDATGRVNAIWADNRPSTMYYSPDNDDLPTFPMNKPGGPTAEWPDNANYSTLSEPLAEPGGRLTRGTRSNGWTSFTSQGAYSDFVWAFPALFHNNGYVTRGSSAHKQFMINPILTTIGNTASSLSADMRYTDASGNLIQVNEADDNPQVVAGTTVSGAHSSGVSTINVASTTGMSAGMKIKIAYPPMARVSNTHRAIHLSTITSVSPGISVTFEDALGRALLGDEDVGAHVAAGARPSAIPPPSEYQTR